MSSNNIVQITGLEKSYEDFRLKNISFNIPKGSIVGLVGENGAGKSTIINLVLDIIKKERGSIEIFGKEQHLLTKLLYVESLIITTKVYKNHDIQ